MALVSYSQHGPAWEQLAPQRLAAHARCPRPGGPPPLVKNHLFAFNMLSAVGWFSVRAGTVFHLIGAMHGRFAAAGAGADTLLGHAAIGWRTAAVQKIAVLEVVHSLLGRVRSPLATVSMQW